ncbi:MAG: hypothetical protein P1S46_01535 [bacterium]|nr:hypothetical protein [bacterium]
MFSPRARRKDPGPGRGDAPRPFDKLMAGKLGAGGVAGKSTKKKSAGCQGASEGSESPCFEI